MSKETPRDYDFAGWATRNNIKCKDGRTILDGAFAHNDGATVPLVYQHDHENISNVLGHAILQNVPGKGVRAYGYFNDTESGQMAKECVMHGDLKSLSVYANRLKEANKNVIHGDIKEISLVQAGANPGALIDVVMTHSDEDGDETADIAILYTDEEIEADIVEDENDDETELEHADEEPKAEGGKSAQEILDSMTEEQQNCCFFMMEKAVELDRKERGAASAEEGETVAHSDEDSEQIEDQSGDAEETADDTESAEEFTEEENDDMKRNAFESNDSNKTDELKHAEEFMEQLDMNDLIDHARKTHSSLRETFLQHADDFGITDLDLLFPDYKNLDATPQFIKRPTDWVSKVLNGVKHVPFAKIRSLFADITRDEARARGYTKGKKKIEEVFNLLKRETNPTTVYKKQKLHKDDIIDLASFEVIGWLRQEMRMMLDEELARAFLIGDGRDPILAADDKIDEEKIRPMAFDDSLFTISKDTTGDAKNIIQTAVRSRIDYRGSGSPTFFTTEEYLTEMLLMEDLNQRAIYETEDKLKTALRVSDIVTVPVMENVTNEAGTKKLVAIIVNLSDYSVGADKGGSINWFDDFDIDFNQQKYLIETRCSGALTKPKSCITLWAPVPQNNNAPAEEPGNGEG